MAGWRSRSTAQDFACTASPLSYVRQLYWHPCNPNTGEICSSTEMRAEGYVPVFNPLAVDIACCFAHLAWTERYQYPDAGRRRRLQERFAEFGTIAGHARTRAARIIQSTSVRPRRLRAATGTPVTRSRSVRPSRRAFPATGAGGHSNGACNRSLRCAPDGDHTGAKLLMMEWPTGKRGSDRSANDRIRPFVLGRENTAARTS